MQDPQQTNIDSVIHSDDTQTPPTDVAVARVGNGHGVTDKSDKANGRVKVPATNGSGNSSNFRLNKRDRPESGAPLHATRRGCVQHNGMGTARRGDFQ